MKKKTRNIAMGGIAVVLIAMAGKFFYKKKRYIKSDRSR